MQKDNRCLLPNVPANEINFTFMKKTN